MFIQSVLNFTGIMIGSTVKYLILLIAIAFSSLLQAQQQYPRYWISFTDKDNTPYSIDKPEEFLSKASLDRRMRQSIEITEEDLPVDPSYLQALEELGINVINVSKWFNGAIIETSNTSSIDSLEDLPFILDPPLLIEPILTGNALKAVSSKLDITRGTVQGSYGPSFNQISMLGGDILHESGNRGEGMRIAVLDAGFLNTDKVSSLKHLWHNKKIIAYRDYVKDSQDIFESHTHGTVVLSILAGIEEGVLYGSAPEAEYVLVRTEKGASEFLREEYNWLCGAEFADSIGVDVINSSLGYSHFDDLIQNHTYQDMDGNTIPISRAAQIASSKGILVVTSAGNEGGTNWHHITAPGDADNILTVGATDSAGIITSFSSRGPSFDGRVKPDVSAQGFRTISQSGSGDFLYCAGTSCSSPVMAGMAACLWQANPKANNLEIIENLRKGSSQYFTPDSVYGYGIPSLIASTVMLSQTVDTETKSDISVFVFPNPTDANLYLNVNRLGQKEEEIITIEVFDSSGRLFKSVDYRISGEDFVVNIGNYSEISTGLFYVKTYLSDQILIQKFSKL